MLFRVFDYASCNCATLRYSAYAVRFVSAGVRTRTQLRTHLQRSRSRWRA